MSALQTHASNTDMPLQMMKVTILRAIYEKSCYNRFATPDVVISTDILVISSPGAGILLESERTEYPAEFNVQYRSAGVPLLIQQSLSTIAIYDWNQHKRNHDDAVR